MQRRDVVGRLPDGLARRQIGHDVVDGDDFADADLDRVLLRLEAPRQSAGDVGVEAHRDVRPSAPCGAEVATCVRPPKPVVRQNQS